MLQLMIDRAYAKFTLERAEDGLDLGQLHVARPQDAGWARVGKVFFSKLRNGEYVLIILWCFSLGGFLKPNRKSFNHLHQVREG
jgi:hypothetical protein